MSTIKADNVSNLAGSSTTSMNNVVNGSAKAWVNFNGVTISIRASYNVSSIIDEDIGIYTIVFATPMPDANFASCIMLGRDAYNIDIHGAIDPFILPTASSLRLRTAFLSQVPTSNYADLPRICVSVFR